MHCWNVYPHRLSAENNSRGRNRSWRRWGGPLKERKWAGTPSLGPSPVSNVSKQLELFPKPCRKSEFLSELSIPWMIWQSVPPWTMWHRPSWITARGFHGMTKTLIFHNFYRYSTKSIKTWTQKGLKWIPTCVIIEVEENKSTCLVKSIVQLTVGAFLFFYESIWVH